MKLVLLFHCTAAYTCMKIVQVNVPKELFIGRVPNGQTIISELEACNGICFVGTSQMAGKF